MCRLPTRGCTAKRSWSIYASAASFVHLVPAAVFGTPTLGVGTMEPQSKHSGDSKGVAANAADGLAIGRLLCGGSEVAVERDFCNGSWRVVLLVTGERVGIPGSSVEQEWAVCEEDDETQPEYGCAYITDDTSSYWAADVFKTHVYNGDGGSAGASFVKDQQGLVLALPQAKRVHDTFVFEIFLGGFNVGAQVRAEVAMLPSDGSRVWVQLISFLQLGNFSIVAKGVGKWVWKMWPSWSRSLEAWGCMAGLKARMRKQHFDEDEVDRWMNVTTISPISLVALCVRLSCCPPHLGGFRNEADCRKAWGLLQALMTRVRIGHIIWVMLDPEVVMDEVLEPSGERPASISFSTDLQCDLSPLLEVIWKDVGSSPVGNGDRRAAGAHDNLLRRLRNLFPRHSSARLPLEELFKLVVREKCLDCIVKQLIWQLGKRVEDTILKERDALTDLKTIDKLPKSHLRPLQFDEWTRDNLSKRCLSYLVSSRSVAASFWRVATLSTDASRVGGRACVVGCAVLPNNIAVWFPPQVRLCGSGVGGGGGGVPGVLANLL